jgi:hypothetical protein
MRRKRKSKTELQMARWLRALTIATILFEDQGSHTRSLEEIEHVLKGYAMTRKHLLDRASTALPSIARYYNDLGEYVEGEGDSLAEYVVRVLIEDFPFDPDLGDGGIVSHLTGILDQAITDISMVCDALETLCAEEDS